MDTRSDVARKLGEAMLAAIELSVGGAIAEAMPSLRSVTAADDGDPEPLIFLNLDEVGRRINLGRTSVEALLKPGGPFDAIKQGRTVSVASDQVLAYQLARKAEAAGGEVQGERPTPIDLGRSRRDRAASSAARHRSKGPRDSEARKRG